MAERLKLIPELLRDVKASMWNSKIDLFLKPAVHDVSGSEWGIYIGGFFAVVNSSDKLCSFLMSLFSFPYAQV